MPAEGMAAGVAGGGEESTIGSEGVPAASRGTEALSWTASSWITLKRWVAGSSASEGQGLAQGLGLGLGIAVGVIFAGSQVRRV